MVQNSPWLNWCFRFNRQDGIFIPLIVNNLPLSVDEAGVAAMRPSEEAKTRVSNWFVCMCFLYIYIYIHNITNMFMFTYVYLDGIKYAHIHTGLYRATHHPGALLFLCCSKLVFFCWICSSQHHTGSIQRYPTFVGFCKNDALQIPKKNWTSLNATTWGKHFFRSNSTGGSVVDQ